MKKLFSVVLLAFTFNSFSQNRQIEFEHGNWASVLEKAQKEKKYIFVDAYTTWCGPCKWLAKNIFTNDTVADYFNANFVNYKLDMEKGEGIEFAKRYEVQCYPTLFIIDSGENLINRSSGAPGVGGLIEYAKNSMDPSKTFPVQKEEMETAGLNQSNALKYFQLLSSNCFNVSSKATAYMMKQNDADLLNETNWKITLDYINNPSSNAIKHLLGNKSSYETKFGKEVVYAKLTDVGNHYFDAFFNQKDFNKNEFEKSKKEFSALKWPDSEKIIFYAELNLTAREDIHKYYSMAAGNFQKHFNNDANALNSMAWKFYENVSDKKQLQAAINMAKRACELHAAYAYLDTYAAVLFKHGDYKEAEKWAVSAIEAAKKSGEDAKETEELLKNIRTKLNG